MGNENDSKNNENNYYMNVNFIGKNMKDLLIACSGLNYSSKASGRSTKLSIFDYWDYSYLPELNFISQVKEITDKFNKMKGELILNFSECLVVHISDLNSPTIDYILERVNKINRVQYIPMILFLSDNFDDKDKNFINLKKKVYKGIIKRYNNLDKRMIFFEKFENDVHNEEKMKKIKNILLRFCSYYNELGDRFSLGQGDKEIFYDLTEDNFPFTINIGCIGRFGKGKSTGVNFLLGEKKAKENKSGTSVTSKINFYHVSHFPIKIYDIPGFENESTILNTVEKFKELNKEINKLRDQLHIILYFIKSNDERMFSEMEFKIFAQITEHEDVRIIFVLTHSSSKTDHKELIDMINTGIKGVIEKKIAKNKKKEEYYIQIRNKIKATEGNTVFVNFYKTSKSDVYGINEYFDTIADHIEASKVYQNFQEGCYADEETFKERIKEEAEIRRIKAKDVLFKHRIGGGLIGMIPAVDWALQKYVVQKDAAKKAGAIFGFDITIYEKQQEVQIQSMGENKNTDKKMNVILDDPQISLNDNNIRNNNNDKDRNNNDKKNNEKNIDINNNIMEENSNNLNKTEDKKTNKKIFHKKSKTKNNITLNLSDINYDNHEKSDDKNITKIEKGKEKENEKEEEDDDNNNKTNYKMKYGRFALSAFTGSVSFTTNAANLLVTSASVALTAATITFSFIGSIVGFGMGSYLITKHCDALLDKFVELFIQNANRLSNSLEYGLKYMRRMAIIYRKRNN